MTDSRICARDGCENTVPPRTSPGRPAIYCSASCRPSASTKQGVSSLVVELDHAPTPEDSRPTGRVWVVRLCRGEKSVVVAEELGRPSADQLVRELNELIGLRPREKKGAIV